MDIRKNFFEIYVQIGHAPSKSFASPDLWQMYKNKTIHVHSFGSKRRVNFFYGINCYSESNLWSFRL